MPLERQPSATSAKRTRAEQANLTSAVAVITVTVESEAHVMEACRRARQLAEQAGFLQTAAYHVATAASELASNLLRHAGGGQFTATLQRDPVGIVLCAEDQGPGIENLALAMEDGFSTQGGLGCGLPGVKRLMDEFEITSTPGVGTWVSATKWLARPARPVAVAGHVVGRALRPAVGQQFCGDQIGYWWHGGRLTLAVADGLGHGPEAHQAAVAAMNLIHAFITRTPDTHSWDNSTCGSGSGSSSGSSSGSGSWHHREHRQPSWCANPGSPGQNEAKTRHESHELFAQLDRNLRDTRGVALAIISVLPATGHLVHAAVGNVRARLEGRKGTRRLGCARGIVGAGYQGLRAECFTIDRDDWIVMFSDGLEENVGLTELEQQKLPSDTLCAELLERYARTDDDAALLLYRYHPQTAAAMS